MEDIKAKFMAYELLRSKGFVPLKEALAHRENRCNKYLKKEGEKQKECTCKINENSND